MGGWPQKQVGGGIDGRWTLNKWWEMGGWPPKQVGDRRLAPKTDNPSSTNVCTTNFTAADETITETSRCPSGINPHLRSGHLLLSLKSRCRCFGKETIDSTEVPEDLLAHGIQIPTRVYRDAIRHLMSESKFRYHILCYNGPAALLFFVALLGACILLTPVLEERLGRPRRSAGHRVDVNGSAGAGTGVELMHGVVVWLCALTLYMVVMHVSKRKMKLNMYRRLTHVNSILIKYNLLTGVENLGLADCNKYYISLLCAVCCVLDAMVVRIFGRDHPVVVPQATLQELMVESDERNFGNQPADVAVDVQFELDDVLNVTDTSRVLESTHLTNDAMQKRAEDLMLRHSGEYISHLIKKKVVRPLYDRHVQDAPCLCQFVEHRVYKMIV
ncbi:hypothetical protein LSAT2_020766 [Lamellibrachia satsuma]|nr:hypothetical protein LSAT2_020766 [Lamellibrachia satsuma]